MLFKAPALEKIAEGRITQAFRHWRRPTVRAGGTLRTAIGVLTIEAVEPVLPETLTADDAGQAGFATVEALLDSVPTRGEGELYRIRFRLHGDDPRAALRETDDLDEAELADIDAQLARLDRGRPWTDVVLKLIGQCDGTTAGEIADVLDIDKPALKRRVRQFKELGLTESLSSGYRLSPRGRAFRLMR